LLKNRANINHYEYKTWKSFRAPKYPFLTEVMMIDRFLSFSAPLKEAYPFFHELVETFQDKDPDLFFSLLAELPETLDDGFREKLQNLLTYEEGITNAIDLSLFQWKNRSEEYAHKDNETSILRI
jgi:hypothetical protein